MLRLKPLGKTPGEAAAGTAFSVAQLYRATEKPQAADGGGVQAQQTGTEPLEARASKAMPKAGPFEWLTRMLRMRNEALALTERMYERHGPAVMANFGRT